MPSIDTTLGFFLIALVLGFTPGPDNLFVLMQSAARGRRAGLLVMAGLCLGLCVHTAAVALGLAAVFAASATAFHALKLAGAAYLAFLAWKAFKAPVSSLQDTPAPPVAARTLVARGLAMNLMNPKVVLFFLAFLPQFVQPGGGPVAAQVFWFGAWFIVATVIAFGAIALLAGTIGQWLRGSPRAETLLNRISALVFAGLAVRLLTAER